MGPGWRLVRWQRPLSLAPRVVPLRASVAQQRRMATLAPAATEPVTSDYVRVRRQMTTTFLWVDPANTAADLKAKIHKITKVPANDIKLFIDKTGDVVLDETKSLADQKACRTPMPLLHGGLCRKRWFAGVCCRRLTTTRSSSWRATTSTRI